MAIDTASLVGGGLMGMLAGFLVVFLVIFAIMYVFVALALMNIAKKTNTPNGWLAWVPIANVYLMTQVAKVSGWYTAGLLLAFIPFIGSLAMLGSLAFSGGKLQKQEIGLVGGAY